MQGKDESNEKLKQQVSKLRDEIERRKFLEAKVQKYVKVLIEQNQKSKRFIKENCANLPEFKRKADLFIQQLENVKNNEDA